VNNCGKEKQKKKNEFIKLGTSFEDLVHMSVTSSPEPKPKEKNPQKEVINDLLSSRLFIRRN